MRSELPYEVLRVGRPNHQSPLRAKKPPFPDEIAEASDRTNRSGIEAKGGKSLHSIDKDSGVQPGHETQEMAKKGRSPLARLEERDVETSDRQWKSGKSTPRTDVENSIGGSENFRPQERFEGVAGEIVV